MTLSILAPVFGDLVDPVWADDITDAVNGAINGVTGSFSVGGDLSVSGIGQLLKAIKASDETVNNSAALQNDDALLLSLSANATYRVIMDLVWNSGTTPDFKFDWTVPSGASGLYTATGTSGAALFLGSLSFATGGNLDGSGSDLYTRFTGLIVTTNAGTLQFRWAQQTATASNTIVRAKSYLLGRRLA